MADIGLSAFALFFMGGFSSQRLPGELLSSWLWRIARGLGAPPKRFALDAIGVPLTDVDREIDDAAIARLAFFSGQSISCKGPCAPMSL